MTTDGTLTRGRVLQTEGVFYVVVGVSVYMKGEQVEEAQFETKISNVFPASTYSFIFVEERTF